MPVERRDRVKDQTTSTGTASFTIGLVSPPGYRTMSAHSNGATVRYAVSNASGNEWETGEGVWNSAANTLSRLTIYSSSTGNAARIAFSGGIKSVVTGPVAQDMDDAVTRTSPETLTNKTLTNPNLTSGVAADAANILWNADAAGSMVGVTIEGNRQLTKPTNLKNGVYFLYIKQGVGGNKLLTYAADIVFTGSAPVLSTTEGSIDVLRFVSNGTILLGSLEGRIPTTIAPPTTTAQPMPTTITTASLPVLWLQTGNPNDAYWVEDNRWGAQTIVEGPAADQYMQEVGILAGATADGAIAARFRGRWPNPAGSGDVKSYPSIISGRKPGYYSSNNMVDGHPIRLPDGTDLQQAPSGHTPGTLLPVQLPVPALKGRASFGHTVPPTGAGHLSYDIWLQNTSAQTSGFMGADISHEIMVPLVNWGNYGGHNVAGGRNPNWYDHDVTLAGRLWHVYCSKGTDGILLSNFGKETPPGGTPIGWKMIAFVPDVFPIPQNEVLDLALLINYISTRYDVGGNRWATGNEHLVSIELGVEPNNGTFDMVVWNYKVRPVVANSTTVSGPTGEAAITAAFAYSGGQNGAWFDFKAQYINADFDNPASTVSVQDDPCGRIIDRSPNTNDIAIPIGTNRGAYDLANPARPGVFLYSGGSSSTGGGSGDTNSNGFYACRSERLNVYTTMLWSDSTGANNGRTVRFSGDTGGIVFSVGTGAARTSVAVNTLVPQYSSGAGLAVTWQAWQDATSIYLQVNNGPVVSAACQPCSPGSANFSAPGIHPAPAAPAIEGGAKVYYGMHTLNPLTADLRAAIKAHVATQMG